MLLPLQVLPPAVGNRICVLHGGIGRIMVLLCTPCAALIGVVFSAVLMKLQTFLLSAKTLSARIAVFFLRFSYMGWRLTDKLLTKYTLTLGLYF